MTKRGVYCQIIKHRGEVDAGSRTIPVIVLLEFDKFDFRSVSCEMTPALAGGDHYRTLAGVVSGHFGKSLSVRPKRAEVSSLRLHGIRGWQLDGSTIRLDISGFDLGVVGTSLSPGYRIYATVDLTSGKVLSKPSIVEFSWRGDVTHKEVYEDDIHWDLPMGSGKALLRYVREDTEVARDRATLLVCRPTIVYDLSVDKDVELTDVVEGLEHDLADVCLMLSLAGRRLVGWYQISCIVLNEEQGPVLSWDPISRYEVFDRTTEGPRDELINHRELTNEGLSCLLRNLRTSSYREELNQIIPFLVSSYTADTLETSYFLCHAALDALCGAIYSKELGQDLLPRCDWEELERILRDAILGCAVKSGATGFGERAVARLPDLKRVGSRERIVAVCRDMGLDTTAIWPRVALEEGLGRALRVRNQLFHGAKTYDSQGLDINLLRLQILVERLLLRVLGWPDDKIWRGYDQALRAVPQS